MLNFRKLGWAIIITVTILLFIPIMGFVLNPVEALQSYGDLIVVFVIVPYVVGALLIFFGRTQRK
jgi:hypothetical protein